MSAVRTGASLRVGSAASAVVALALLGACTVVGPDYERPGVTLPGGYGVDSATAAAGVAPIAGDWWTAFGDARLDALVAAALANNTDIQVAVARIEEADAAMREAGAALLPRIDLGAAAGRSRTSGLTAARTPVLSNNVQVAASTAYEIDFWGRLQRGTEAARAQALASRHAHDVVRLTVGGLTAQAWFSLRSLDAQSALTRDTLAARDEALRIVRLRTDAGTASRLDLEQASTARAEAAIQARDLLRQRELVESLLGRLSGQPGLRVEVTVVPTAGPHAATPAAPPAATPAASSTATSPDPSSAIAATAMLATLPVPPQPPLGLPSELLVRRPDVRQAEEQLIAANAQIGVARAAMLPSISLTGALGAQSTALSTLLDSGARIWSIGFGLSLPIFDGGRLEARTDQAVARQRQALAAYQGAAQSAFREVSDALIAARAAREAEADLLARTGSTERSLRIAQLRYEAGYSGYLEVLDAQRSANAAALDAVRNRQARLAAAVDLFKALSGGWTDATTPDRSALSR